MKYFISHLTEVKLPMAILLSVIAISAWIPSLLEQSIDTLICLALTIGNAALLMQICYQANINRIHSIFPILMYVLPISALPYLQSQWMQQIYVFIYLLIFYILIKIYRKENAVEESFLTTLLLLCGTIVYADLIWFIPILWLSFYLQQAFNIKVLLASIIAIAISFIIVLCIIYLPINLDINIEPKDIINHHSILNDFNTITASQIVLSITTIVFLLFSLINFSRATVNNQSFIIILILTAIPAIVLTIMASNAYFPMTTLTVLCIAGFSSYIFQKEANIVRGVSFLIYLLILLSSRILFIYF